MLRVSYSWRPRTLSRQLLCVSRDGDPTTFSVQPVQCSITHSKESVFWCSGKTLFQFVPTASCPITVYHWKALPLSSVISTHWWRSAWAFSLLSPLSLSSQERHCSPSIISVVLGCSLSSSPTSPVHWGAPDWTLQPQGTSAGEELQLPQPAPPRLPLVAGTINPLPWPLLLGHIAGSPPICRALGPQGLSWRMIPKPLYN